MSDSVEPKGCVHGGEMFSAVVVRRIEDPDRSWWYAEIRISCKVCGLDFQFVGTPAGMSPLQPMASADGLVLRAPLEPGPRAIEPYEHYTVPTKHVDRPPLVPWGPDSDKVRG